MVLKRGENVGDRYIKHTTEQEILELIDHRHGADGDDGGRGFGRGVIARGRPLDRLRRSPPPLRG